MMAQAASAGRYKGEGQRGDERLCPEVQETPEAMIFTEDHGPDLLVMVTDLTKYGGHHAHLPLIGKLRPTEIP